LIWAFLLPGAINRAGLQQMNLINCC